MRDTSEKFRAYYHGLLMKRSGIERLHMGFSMFESAKTIVVTSIREQEPGISPADLRTRIFDRFYGDDFGDKQKEAIKKHLASLEK